MVDWIQSSQYFLRLHLVNILKMNFPPFLLVCKAKIFHLQDMSSRGLCWPLTSSGCWKGLPVGRLVPQPPPTHTLANCESNWSPFWVWIFFIWKTTVQRANCSKTILLWLIFKYLLCTAKRTTNNLKPTHSKTIFDQHIMNLKKSSSLLISYVEKHTVNLHWSPLLSYEQRRSSLKRT